MQALSSYIQFVNLLDSLNKALSLSRNSAQYLELRDLIEVVRMNYEMDNIEVTTSTSTPGNRIAASALSMMYTGVKQAKEFDDPQGLKEKSEQLLLDWIQNHSNIPQKHFNNLYYQ
jgi:hypothetical protein